MDAAREVGRGRRGAGLYRRVHSELAVAAESVIALVISTAVVWSIRGVPDLWSPGLVSVIFVGLTVVCGLSALTRWGWMGGNRHWWESAVAVSDPGLALPTTRQSWARGSDPYFMGKQALMGIGLGLLVASPLALLPLATVPDRVATAFVTFWWERRNELVLWQGKLAEQPLSADQFLYSTPRPRRQGAGRQAHTYAPLSGSLTVNTVEPGSPRRVIVPPWARTRERATERPRPLPPRSRVRALSTR